MKLDPGCIIMLFVAIILDALGILFTLLDVAAGVGEIPSFVSDAAGTVIIGGWLFFKSMLEKAKAQEEERNLEERMEEVRQVPQKRKEMKKTIQKMEKMKKAKKMKAVGKSKKWLKYLRVGGIIGEYVPVLGVLPFWTLIVIGEMRK